MVLSPKLRDMLKILSSEMVRVMADDKADLVLMPFGVLMNADRKRKKLRSGWWFRDGRVVMAISPFGW
jgi:hypothetical protein